MGNKLITHFHLRNGIIYLRLTINGERTDMSTNHKINPSLWSKSLQKVKGKDENTYLINASLNLLLSKVIKIFNDIDIKNESVSVFNIINRLKGKDKSQITLFKDMNFI
jgi:Arm DNA-binding domain